MFDADRVPELKKLINEQAARDRVLLDGLLVEVRAAAGAVRTIKPRSATSVALMAADGGNNHVAFNPFYLHIIRVVDSHGKELFMDVVSPTTSIAELSGKHLDGAGPHTPLGRLMVDLGVGTLTELSHMMNEGSRGWVLTYRDLCEWAMLYDLICYKDFAQDTLIVHDGLLRCKLLRDDLFVRMYGKIRDAIDRIAQRDRRRVWLVGLAKKNEVLDYYRLAISLARIFDRGSPCFVAVPMAMQNRVYRWPEYTRNPDDDAPGEKPKYNMGAMHFVRFGSRSGDPTWAVDLLECQKSEAQAIFGYLLADAVAGFPVPFYPNCLQQADNHSRVADLDLDVVEDSLVEAIRNQVGPDLSPIVDELRLATDVAARRYE
jgi:hypothetical protein